MPSGGGDPAFRVQHSDLCEGMAISWLGCEPNCASSSSLHSFPRNASLSVLCPETCVDACSVAIVIGKPLAPPAAFSASLSPKHFGWWIEPSILGRNTMTVLAGAKGFTVSDSVGAVCGSVSRFDAGF